MKDFIILTLGTGLGSGIVVNGQVVYGHTGFAGELGHTIIVQAEGPAAVGVMVVMRLMVLRRG
jgi:glucokinase